MANGNYEIGEFGYGVRPNYAVSGQQPVQYSPRLLGDVNFRGGLDSDQFEKSSGGSALGTIATTTALGAAAAGATGFTLMSNPIEVVKDAETGETSLKVKEGFWNTFDKVKYQNTLEQLTYDAKSEALKEFAVNPEQYAAVEKLAKAENLESLSEEVRNSLPKEIQTPEAAQELVTKAEPKLQAIDTKKIVEEAQRQFRIDSAELSMNRVKNYETLIERLKELKPEATQEEIKAFLEENKSLFTIKDEAALAKHLEKMAELNQAELLETVQEAQQANADRLAAYTDGILENVDKKTGKLLEEASESTKKLFGEFKISQLKRYGKIGALAGLGIGSILALTKRNS